MTNLFPNNETDLADIVALGNMLQILMAQPDAETALSGMICVARHIVEHAESHQQANGRRTQAAQDRLDNALVAAGVL